MSPFIRLLLWAELYWGKVNNLEQRLKVKSGCNRLLFGCYITMINHRCRKVQNQDSYHARMKNLYKTLLKFGYLLVVFAG